MSFNENNSISGQCRAKHIKRSQVIPFTISADFNKPVSRSHTQDARKKA